MHIKNLLNERVFLNKWVYDEAEKAYYCKSGVSACSGGITTSSITDEVTKLRQQLQNQLGSVDTSLNVTDLVNRLNKLELENSDLRSQLKSLETRISQLEKGDKPAAAAAKPAAAPAKPVPAPAKPAAKKDENDDDFDLFGDDDDKEEESEERKKRLQEYAAKKSKKPELIAKSNIILDVKPWDDETDMKKLEESVRSVAMDGLLWGTSKLVPVAYGVKKLQITCVIEDDKVSTELLEEQITAFEDFVQSVDIVAFNKI